MWFLVFALNIILSHQFGFTINTSISIESWHISHGCFCTATPFEWKRKLGFAVMVIMIIRRLLPSRMCVKKLFSALFLALSWAMSDLSWSKNSFCWNILTHLILVERTASAMIQLSTWYFLNHKEHLLLKYINRPNPLNSLIFNEVISTYMNIIVSFQRMKIVS